MRKIIHIDMDCFYAAVEMRDNPQYVNVPLAIGGSRERRGVISTCNYPARKFGVRSAMATATALRLCPNLVLVPGRMDVYQQVSAQIRQIFARYTDKIEPLSLDEAYLDVTESDACQGSATLIAEKIRQDILSETGLTASAGVAPCKFVAKIASDENKPNGICVVTPAQLDAFVRRQPLEKIPGVGKATLVRLHEQQLFTCADVRRSSQATLIELLGKFGFALWQRSHGIDERALTLSRQRKSIGVERTFAEDIYTPEQCLEVVARLQPTLKRRMQQADCQRVASQGLKLKFADFVQTTVEHKVSEFTPAFFQQLLAEGLARQQGRGIRLIGLTVGLPTNTDISQMSFCFEPLESEAGSHDNSVTYN